MTPDNYIDRLAEISNKKHILLTDMLDLTHKQSEAVTEDGLEALEKLIDAKQKIIDEINKLDDEFSVYYQRLKSELKVKSLDEVRDPSIKGVKELQESINSIMQLIKEIGAVEKLNSQKADKLLNTFADEIKKINQGKKLNNAYSPGYGNFQTSSYFIDKKK